MKYLILGGGGVTSEFYLPALTMMGLADQVKVVDPMESSLAEVRRRFPQSTCVAQGYADFLKSLTPGGPERVIIALPNALHVDAAGLALAGGRHVLCEKPLSLAATDCARLRDQAATRGLVLKIAMSRRYLASLAVARQMIAAGELGAVTDIEVRDCSAFRWNPRTFAFFAPQSGGVLADMGVHYLDFLDTLVGPLAPVTYEDDARGGTESSASYRLHANGIPVDLRLSRLHDAGAYVRITCEKGEIRVDKHIETGLKVQPLRGPLRRVSVEQPFDNPDWPAGFHGSFCQMLTDFERSIAGERTPIADVEDAMRAAALIEWAYARRTRPVTTGKPDRGTALVTGATGFIGGHLVERLTGLGDTNVRVTARSPASCANVSRFPVEVVAAADLLDAAAVRQAVGGAAVVYHLAYGKDGPDAAKVTIDGTKNVVEAAIACGAECVVVLSTMYIFGFPAGERPVDESFPYRPYGGEYGESKAEMERWCLERAKTSGPTRIVVINPTCVFGPGGGAYTTLPVDLASKGQFCWVDGGDGTCNYTYVENVVDALLAAARQPAAHGQRFIINDGALSWRQFLEPMIAPLNVDVPSYTLAELAGLPRFGGRFRWRDLVAAVVSSESVRMVGKRSAWVRWIFARMARAAEKQGRHEHALSYSPPPVAGQPNFPPEWLADLYSPRRAVFTSAKAARVLGWKPARGLEDARARTIEWLRETGRLPTRSMTLPSSPLPVTGRDVAALAPRTGRPID